MSNPTPPLPETLTTRLVNWLKTPQGTSLLTNALTPIVSFVSVPLIKWGFPELDMGMVTQGVIYATPFVISTTISAIRKTKAAILAQAAEIVAGYQIKNLPMSAAVAQAAVPLATAVASMPDATIVKGVAAMPGIEMQVGESASAGAKAVASDPAVQNVTHA